MIPRAVFLALVSLSERLLAHNKEGFCLTLVSLSKRPLAHGGQLTSMCCRIITKPNLTGKGCLINKILAVFSLCLAPTAFWPMTPSGELLLTKRYSISIFLWVLVYIFLWAFCFQETDELCESKQFCKWQVRRELLVDPVLWYEWTDKIERSGGYWKGLKLSIVHNDPTIGTLTFCQILWNCWIPKCWCRHFGLLFSLPWTILIIVKFGELLLWISLRIIHAFRSYIKHSKAVSYTHLTLPTKLEV